MSVTIAMPRMSTDPELTTAQSKYVESLARAGAEVHWVELSDPDAAAAEALTCDGRDGSPSPSTAPGSPLISSISMTIRRSPFPLPWHNGVSFCPRPCCRFPL